MKKEVAKPIIWFALLYVVQAVINQILTILPDGYWRDGASVLAQALIALRAFLDTGPGQALQRMLLSHLPAAALDMSIPTLPTSAGASVAPAAAAPASAETETVFGEEEASEENA